MSEEALQIAKEEEKQKAKEKRKAIPILNAQFQRIARKIRKPSKVNNAKKNR